MRPRTVRIVLLALLAVAVLSAASATASPRPVDVCQPCGDRFASHLGRETGTETEFTRSVANVEVRQDGTGVWTIRNELANASAAAYLREHPDELRAVAEHGFSVHDAELQSARITDGDVVVLEYRMPGFATRTAGVWRVDYFREQPGAYVYYRLGADELTVVGPEGTRVTSGMPGGTADGNRLTTTEYRDQGDGSFVVFAPDDDPLAAGATWAAIWQAVGGVVLRNAVLLVVIPGAVLAGLAWGCNRLAAGGYLDAGREPARNVAGLVIGLGLVVAALSTPAAEAAVFGVANPWGVVGGVAAAGIGVVAWLRPGAITPARQVGALAGGLLVGVGVWAALTAAIGGSVRPEALAEAALAVVPPLWLLVVGSTGHAGARTRGLVVAVPVLSLAVTATVQHSMTSAGGALFMVVPVLLVGYAVVATVAGLPLWALGAALPDGEPPAPPRGEHRAADPARWGDD